MAPNDGQGQQGDDGGGQHGASAIDGPAAGSSPGGAGPSGGDAGDQLAGGGPSQLAGESSIFGELPAEMQDRENSVAFNVLDQLCGDGLIPAEQMELLKNKYAKVHDFVLQAWTSEKDFLKRAKQLNHSLMSILSSS